MYWCLLKPIPSAVHYNHIDAGYNKIKTKSQREKIKKSKPLWGFKFNQSKGKKYPVKDHLIKKRSWRQNANNNCEPTTNIYHCFLSVYRNQNFLTASSITKHNTNWLALNHNHLFEMLDLNKTDCFILWQNNKKKTTIKVHQARMQKRKHKEKKKTTISNETATKKIFLQQKFKKCNSFKYKPIPTANLNKKNVTMDPPY